MPRPNFLQRPQFGFPCIIHTCISTESDCCGLAPKNSGKFPKNTISRNSKITNKRLSCAKELVQNVSIMKCRKALWLQAAVLWSNCKRMQSSESRFLLCKEWTAPSIAAQQFKSKLKTYLLYQSWPVYSTSPSTPYPAPPINFAKLFLSRGNPTLIILLVSLGPLRYNCLFIQPIN